MRLHNCVLLIAMVNICYGFGDRDHDDVQLECTNRFEYRFQLKRMFGNCSYLIKLNPSCGRNITIAYSSHPPYVYREEDGSMAGILPTMVNFALESCCFGCNKIIYQGPFEGMDRFYQHTSLALPIQTSIKTSKYFGHDYIHMYEIKAVSFIGFPPKHASDERIKTIFRAVYSTWPLFTSAIFMSVTAGVLIWVLDSSFNQQDFPDAFPRGPFEGFWWAVISMTTVGYGDRSPRTVAARLFAMVWIFIGITIFSMFSATLTTALTSAVISSHEIPLYKKNFAVLNTTTVGTITTMKQSASHKGFGTVKEVKDALRKNAVDGIALDENIYNYFAEHAKGAEKMDLQLYSRILITGSSYGMVSYDENFTNLFKSFFDSNDDQRDIMALLGMGEHMNDNLVDKVAVSPAQMFNSPTMLYPTLLTLTGITTVLVCIGLGIKWMRERRKLLTKNNETELLEVSKTDRNNIIEERYSGV